MKYTADFETTTVAPARVWAWAICNIESPDIWYRGESIESFIDTVKQLNNPTLYFHNLKFDDSYILYWLLKNGFEWRNDRRKVDTKTFTTIISGDGKFYGTTIYFKKSGHKVQKCTIYDSLKLLNMPVESVAKTFKLPIKKGCIDYDRHNKECEITVDEWDYLYTDVKIMALALNEMFSRGFTKMTIGGCALADYKEFIGINKFKYLFPVLDSKTDSKIRASYRGGFTFANPDHVNQDIGQGIVFDVNSLYPSVMAFRPLPYGIPLHFTGQYVKNNDYPLYVQNFRCFFKLKENHIPTIQLKHNIFYSKTQYLTSSISPKTGQHEYTELCLTSVDLELFFAHYNVWCIEYIDGFMFKSSTKLFGEWVEKWNAVKVQATIDKNAGLRQIAKLMLNNLYGKFGTNPLVDSKYPILDVENDLVKYNLIEYIAEDERGNPIKDENGDYKMVTKKLRDSIYIPVATFITAWARYTTITASQKIHEESIKKFGVSRYLYSDTDSIHLSGLELPDCIEIHDTKLGAWKHESSFYRARFIQAKRYIEDEYIKSDNGDYFIKNSYGDFVTELKITCAGLSDTCYKYVTFENFKIDAEYSGKLKPVTVPGGCILVPTPFKMR